ncbi:hypothetical protein ILUMI_11035, partial [Ignelater luminosus]
SCDHFRSVEYMAESINSDSFIARPCVNCALICNPDDSRRNEFIIMGEGCPRNASGSYVVETNSEAPFGKRLRNVRRRNTSFF